MQRENRYLVLKLSDVNAVLTQPEQLALYRICTKVLNHRKDRGAGALQCVVVESDWVEYEPTWAAIAARVDAAA